MITYIARCADTVCTYTTLGPALETAWVEAAATNKPVDVYINEHGESHLFATVTAHYPYALRATGAVPTVQHVAAKGE